MSTLQKTGWLFSLNMEAISSTILFIDKIDYFRHSAARRMSSFLRRRVVCFYYAFFTLIFSCWCCKLSYCPSFNQKRRRANRPDSLARTARFYHLNKNYCIPNFPNPFSNPHSHYSTTLPIFSLFLPNTTIFIHEIRTRGTI